MNSPDVAAALHAGAPDAAGQLYDAHAQALFQYCWLTLRNRQHAQTAVCDALVQAGARVAELSDPGTLRAWLFTLARAECHFHPLPSLGDTDEAIARPEQPDAALRIMAWNSVMSLDLLERQALDLNTRHGMTEPEIGLILSLPLPGATELLASARETLGRALGAQILVGRDSLECPGRTEAIHGWTGTVTPAFRDRLLEHAGSCRVCRPKLPQNVSPGRIFGLLPAPVMDSDTRSSVMTRVSELVQAELAEAEPEPKLGPTSRPLAEVMPQPAAAAAAAAARGRAGDPCLRRGRGMRCPIRYRRTRSCRTRPHPTRSCPTRRPAPTRLTFRPGPPRRPRSGPAVPRSRAPRSRAPRRLRSRRPRRPVPEPPAPWRLAAGRRPRGVRPRSRPPLSRPRLSRPARGARPTGRPRRRPLRPRPGSRRPPRSPRSPGGPRRLRSPRRLPSPRRPPGATVPSAVAASPAGPAPPVHGKPSTNEQPPPRWPEEAAPPRVPGVRRAGRRPGRGRRRGRAGLRQPGQQQRPAQRGGHPVGPGHGGSGSGWNGQPVPQPDSSPVVPSPRSQAKRPTLASPAAGAGAADSVAGGKQATSAPHGVTRMIVTQGQGAHRAVAVSVPPTASSTPASPRARRRRPPGSR